MQWKSRLTRMPALTRQHRNMRKRGVEVKFLQTALILALVASAASCSHTEAAKPTIQLKLVKTQLPPAARRSAPLTVIPDRDLTQNDVYDLWARDRKARNVESIGRRACVAAVDGTAGQ